MSSSSLGLSAFSRTMVKYLEEIVAIVLRIDEHAGGPKGDML
jgi:hypothetical protein